MVNVLSNRDIDIMMQRNNVNNDGLSIVNNLDEINTSNDGLVEMKDIHEDIFDEDPESIKRRKRKNQAKILLERQKINNQYPNSNQYINKERR